jgi:thymidylate synthase ThyX
MAEQQENFRKISDIKVELVGSIANPYELAVASARTCYSGRGVIYPGEVSKDERSVEIRDRIASSTLEAGHLTTRQHAHFVFAISGVSRQFVWSFLHSHPFYNSEQVSQRYVRVKQGNFLVPELPPSEAKLFAQTVTEQMQSYERLITLLKIPLSKDYYERFKARAKTPEKYNSAIDKRAFEVARYVLGLGTTAYLYHTVSALTLLRYAKLCELFDTPEEQREVIRQMLDRVREVDPLFEKELSDPVKLEDSLEYRCRELFQAATFSDRTEFASEFDKQLNGRVSLLVDYSSNPEEILARATRVVLGLTAKELSTEAAIALVLDPQSNTNLADTINLASLDRLSQILHHVHFTFQKKISHTADSQDQRHRTVLSSRPMLALHYNGKPDFITPYGITQSQEAMEVFSRTMEKSFSAVNALLNAGVKPEYAFYLLPNALSIRMVSTGDLHSLQHKWRLRACYNAQEEIFRATIDEVNQVSEIAPQLAMHLRAPCYVRLRAGRKPYCPEGDKFCGMPVWKFALNQYERKSL